MWTVHNQDWSFARLAEEIEEEHRYFADREQLYAIFSASNHKDPQAYAPASWKAYAATLTRLYGQLVRQEPSPQELKAMLEEACPAERMARSAGHFCLACSLTTVSKATKLKTDQRQEAMDTRERRAVGGEIRALSNLMRRKILEFAPPPEDPEFTEMQGQLLDFLSHHPDREI